MLLLEFVNLYNGIANVGDTDKNKGECVGLVEVWIDSIGLSHDWGNAKDLLTNANPNDFQIIQKANGNLPIAGDILVWDATWGNGNGHTGIVIYASPTSFTCFEQNNPTGSICHLVTHANWNGVLGWLHPKNAPIDQQAQINQANHDRDTNWNTVSSVVSYMGVIPNPDNKDQMILDAKAKWDEQKSLLASCQNKNTEYEQNITNLTAEVKDVTDQNASLAAAYEKEAGKNSQTITDGRKAINLFTKLQNYLQPILNYYKITNVDLNDPQKTVATILDKVIEEEEKKLTPVVTSNPQSEPTVSQARVAVAIAKKPSLWSQIKRTLQNAGILVQ